jgi:hypothetical protein
VACSRAAVGTWRCKSRSMSAPVHEAATIRTRPSAASSALCPPLRPGLAPVRIEPRRRARANRLQIFARPGWRGPPERGQGRWRIGQPRGDLGSNRGTGRTRADRTRQDWARYRTTAGQGESIAGEMATAGWHRRREWQGRCGSVRGHNGGERGPLTVTIGPAGHVPTCSAAAVLAAWPGAGRCGRQRHRQCTDPFRPS